MHEKKSRRRTHQRFPGPALVPNQAKACISLLWVLHWPAEARSRQKRLATFAAAAVAIHRRRPMPKGRSDPATKGCDAGRPQTTAAACAMPASSAPKASPTRQCCEPLLLPRGLLLQSPAPAVAAVRKDRARLFMARAVARRWRESCGMARRVLTDR